MKNILVLLLLACLFVTVSTAQIYVREAAEYGLSLDAKFPLGQNIMTQPGGPYLYNEVNGSFGRGFRFGGAVGYKMTSHLTEEVGVQYLSGESITIDGTAYVYSIPIVTASENFVSHMLAITPSIILSSEVGNLTPFIRLGAIAAYPKIMIERTTIIGTVNATTVSEFHTLSGPVAWGASAGTGVMVPVGANFQLTTEIGFSDIQWTPNKDDVRTTANGTTTAATTDLSKNPVTYPFSHFGLSIGLMYSFQ